MNVLFYLSPFAVRGDPQFHAGALQKKMIPQALQLLAKGASVSFITNEFCVPYVESAILNADCKAINQTDLLLAFGSTRDLEQSLYREGDSELVKQFGQMVAAKVDRKPDVVIAWETPANFMKAVFPDALVLHEMPGFLSRVPYPELYTFEPHGLFNQSCLKSEINAIARIPKDNRAASLVEGIKSELFPFISQESPYSRADLDPTGRYERLLLLPLQVTAQYAFKEDSLYESQMELLLDVLTGTPTDIGVVVTQYSTGSTSDKVLDEKTYVLLKDQFPHLIYKSKFDEIDNISQYLLSCVDAVFTVSSSIGVQALMWGKPLIVAADTHLAPLADFHSVNAYVDSLNKFENGNRNKELILQWMLAYQQPLAHHVLNDPDFLFNWLNKVVENKRNGLHGIHLFPNLFDLVPNYANAFLGQCKIERARELLQAKNRTKTKDTAADFLAKVKQEKPQIISFDVFDTLLDRTVEQPAHLFKFMERDVERLTDGRITNFAVCRPAAERALRERVSSTTERQDITLAEIYEEIGKNYGVDSLTLDVLADFEIQQEGLVLSRREAGWRLYQMARKHCQRVILVSDMYLPKAFLEKTLALAGYTDYDAFYLSCEIGLRKHEGALFEHVQRSENVEYSAWLHIGDNPHGDIAMPKQYGINTYMIPSAYQVVRGNKRLDPIVNADRRTRTLAESAMYGLIQKRFFDNPGNIYFDETHFNGSSFNLGYMSMGPMLFGFLHWTMQSARADGIEKLLFLSRDGKILWQMASILFPKAEGWPAIEYSLSSRRSARVASIFNRGDISALMDSSLGNATLKDIFNGKFGIDLVATDRPLLQEHGFADEQSKITANVDRERVRALALALDGRIFARAEKERGMLTDYYASLGVVDGARIAVVDIGYAATMQVAIERITTARNVAGYYYITFDTALDNSHRTGPIKGYAANFAKQKTHSHPICSNGFLFETLFCCTDRSFVCFEKTDSGRVYPRFEMVENDVARKRVIDEIHLGALTLARDLKTKWATRLEQLCLNPESGVRLLADFIAKPGGRDAEIFEGVIFDDAFGGGQVRYIVPPRELIIKNPDVVAKSVWRQGAEVFGRQSDLKHMPASLKSSVKQNDAKSGPAAGNVSAVAEVSGPISRSLALTVARMMGGAAYRFERRLIPALLHGKKLAKYSRDRHLFFVDSRNVPIQLYWKLLGQFGGERV